MTRSMLMMRTQLNGQEPAVFVDMSGNGNLTHALHHHYGAHMVSSVKVGATHWQDFTTHEALPGATPEFFFAPTQIEKRNKEWGRVFYLKSLCRQH